uniref:Uncharacterized protein n=1 Tax=Human betaherpesvirus 6 TaxID=10368 RepID=A0A5P9U3L8_9BETA|nr:hypothetical protein [Human betaherpesvirus 6]
MGGGNYSHNMQLKFNSKFMKLTLFGEILWDA